MSPDRPGAAPSGAAPSGAAAAPPHTALGPGGEFDVIRALVHRWGHHAAGVGDDAALLDVAPGERLVASTDTSVEGVHFRTDWLTPREIGYRATAAALSDLAAMGATPLGILLALTAPARWLSRLAEVSDGVAEAAALAGAPIVGGDLVSGGDLALAVTVLGGTSAPLERRAVRPGDALYITGALGGPLAALRDLSRGVAPDAAARERFAHPVARVAEARWLAARGARAAIDISDGLVADAAHLAAASGVLLRLALDGLPTVAGVGVREAAASGEEYELLVALPAGASAAGFERTFSLPLTCVGGAEAGAPEVVVTIGGERVAPPAGYSHF